MTRIAIIDSQITGISGDMLLSSLIDAGANKNKVINAIIACQNFVKGSKIIDANFYKTISHGFSATRFELEYKDSTSHRRGIEMFRSLALCCDSLDLEQRAKTFVLESFKTIITSEAFIHGVEISKVHLNELSSIDTFADLVGCATALQDLGLLSSRIFSTKVAVGGGTLKFSHGTIPNPSNIILEIFKGKPFKLIGGQTEGELTTPTGAAMLVNLTSECINYYPCFSPERMGYGMGHKKLRQIPNLLRLVIGNSSLSLKTNTDNIYVIETNVDDISGEIIGNLIDLLTDAGAKDVTAIPGVSKKNRPMHLLRIIIDQTQLDGILEMLFRESGSTGVRVQEIQRFILPRTIITVPINILDNHFDIRVKIAKNTIGDIVNIKPEFEDIKAIASKLGIPLKRTMEIVNADVLQKIGTR
jgi:pyridinium-3,5-bisthiocarboxylic acid mononucleotide nickel chelatase